MSLAVLAAIIIANIVLFAVVLPRSRLGELPPMVAHADLSAAVEIQCVPLMSSTLCCPATAIRLCPAVCPAVCWVHYGAIHDRRLSGG